MGREMASAFARWCALEEIGVTPVLTAVADLSEPVLAWFDRIPTVRLKTRDYRELLASSEVDVVYVALTNEQHLPWTLAALAAASALLAAAAEVARLAQKGGH